MFRGLRNLRCASDALRNVSGRHLWLGTSRQAPNWKLGQTARWASQKAPRGKRTPVEPAKKASIEQVRKTAAEPEKLVYPERLLVYHAGSMRTAYIGVSKVATFIVAGLAIFYVAPTVYQGATDLQGYLWVPGVAIGGLVPLLWTARATHPYAVYVHVILPRTARISRQSLLTYLNGAKQDITLDITTLNFFGFGRPTRMRLGELMARSETIGNIANLVHRSAALRKGAGRSFIGRPHSFYVGTQVNHAKEPKLWNALLERVQKENAWARG